MIRRFQPTLILNPFEVLPGTKQEGSVTEYRERFEIYSGPLRISGPRYLKGVLVKGLKEDRAELRMHPL